MKLPKCPSCEKHFTILQGIRFINPWKIKCPHCGIMLEMTLSGKIAAGFAPFVGLAIAGAAIYFEEIGRWQTINSLIFFAIVFTVLFIVGIALWPFSKFKIKKQENHIA